MQTTKWYGDSPVPRTKRQARRWVVALGVLGLSALGAAVSLGNGVVVQEFFMPLPESQIYAVFNKQAPFDPIDVNMLSRFSIIVTTPDTVVKYDEWEDGYEADMNTPLSPTTQVWGDGINANGICPGFASDPTGLVAGTVIYLSSDIPAPVRGTNIVYDAGDLVAATKAITISRACREDGPGVVQRGSSQACTVEVLSTLDHGTAYVAPVGTNVPANGMFSFVDLMVMADENNTTVIVDPDGPGPVAPFTTNVNRGAVGAFMVENICKGATVKADKMIQVHMMTGNEFNGQFETRSFVLRPAEYWSTRYIIPAGTVDTNYPGVVYLFNTNAAPLAVAFTNRAGGGTLTVPGNNGLLAYTLPTLSGTLLQTTNGASFCVICAMDTDPIGIRGADFDWGFAPIPFEGLTAELVCGWGPGADTNSEFWTGTENASPVWVTALSNTTLYVDFNGDGSDDTNYVVAALECKALYDPDNDQTGMRVHTIDGTVIAGAWGEDASRATPGPPFFDMGYALVPFPIVSIVKTSVLLPEFDTAPTNVLNVDDVVEFTLRVNNMGLLPLGNLIVFDNLAQQLRYVTNTTTLNGMPVTDNPPPGTAFPLDRNPPPGLIVTSILPRAEAVFTYRVRIISPGTIVNIGFAGEDGPGQLSATNTIFAYTAIAVSNASVIEGNSGITNMVFTVMLSSPSPDDVTVDFFVSDGTATTADNDYVTTNGTLWFPAGETTASVVVPVNGDTVIEPDETLFLTLTNATAGGVILDPQATGTIINDDGRLAYQVDWVYNPRRDSWYGTLTISNDMWSASSIQAPVWYEVSNSVSHRLRFPTGADTETGPNWFYLDLSAPFDASLLTVGNGDEYLDPGESVVCSTNIELWGRGSVSNTTTKFYDDLLKVAWVFRFGVVPRLNNDADGDAIPDEWEAQYPSLLSSSDPSDADKDSDRDGMSNLAEYIAGTDPGDPCSRFLITVVSDSGSNRLQWKGLTNRTYSVLCSTNSSAESYSVMVSNIVGAEPLTVFTDTNPASCGRTFYQVEVHLK